MRDGVVLRADVHRPAHPGSFPVLVYRTPYGRTPAGGMSTVASAVARGYAVVVQDVRGRYDSEGDFEPYRHEGRDGFDTIEWAARQPWSDGRVGTFGLSYPGAVQWLAAVEDPPHLEAMVPAMTFSSPSNFFYSGGVFDLSWLGWIWNNVAPDARARRGLPGPRTGEEARAAWRDLADPLRRRLPLRGLEEFREVAPYLFAWLAHPPGDAYWDWAELRSRQGRTRAAVLNLSGWYDEAYGPEGAVANFRGLQEARRGRDLRARLVLGPWVHGVDAIGQTRFGQRELGPAAALDYDALVLDFLDRHVRKVRGPEDRRPPVRVFVMGEGWREGPTFPLPGTSETSLYLAPAAGGERFGILAGSPPSARESRSSFVSEPADPLIDPFAADQGGWDYRDLPRRADTLTFETPPLPADLRVVGAVRAEIHLSCDAPDTDLWVRLFDVAPGGTAFNLMNPGNDVLRASYRAGGPGRRLLRPGESVLLRLPSLLTGNLFRKGHRLRVVLMTSFMPHYSRNLHTGEPETTSSATRRARITIHHERGRASRLVLPVLED
jgi:putative CocE/NonD family hydrolase